MTLSSNWNEATRLRIPSYGAPLAAPSEPPMDAAPSESRPSWLPRVDVLKAQKTIVTVYRFAGFAVLTFILLGLLSYLAQNLFFYASHAWVVPTVMSPTDERVLRLEALAAQETSARSGLLAQRFDLDARARDATRTADVEDAFQEGFRLAMETDLGDRRRGLSKFRALLGSYGAAKGDILRSSAAFSGVSRKTLRQEYDAHVIREDELVGGNLQLAQLAGANLALKERGVEIDERVVALHREVESLRAAAEEARTGARKHGAVSYDVLRIKHEFDRSRLDGQRAHDQVDALRQSLTTIDGAIAVHDRLIATVQRSPYVLATDHDVTIAFVPYDNKEAATVGTAVYGCYVGFVVCKEVGRVAEVLDGELEAKHPLHNKDMRGIAVRVELTDATWAEKPVFYLGHKPLLF